MSDSVTLKLSRRDVGRILSGLKERHRKMHRGIEKFGEDFDPVKGANMLEGEKAYRALIDDIEDQLG